MCSIAFFFSYQSCCLVNHKVCYGFDLSHDLLNIINAYVIFKANSLCVQELVICLMGIIRSQ